MIKDGFQQGIEQGKEQGKEQGIEESKHQICRNLLQQNVDIKIIQKATGLLEEKIQHIQQELQDTT